MGRPDDHSEDVAQPFRRNALRDSGRLPLDSGPGIGGRVDGDSLPRPPARRSHRHQSASPVMGQCVCGRRVPRRSVELHPCGVPSPGRAASSLRGQCTRHSHDARRRRRPRQYVNRRPRQMSVMCNPDSPFEDYRRVARRIWLGWALFVVYGSAAPFRFVPDLAFASAKLAEVRLQPWRGLLDDDLANLLLFAPFGFFGLIGSRIRSTPARLALVGGLAASLSLAIETLQLFTIDRFSSVDDVAANTLGPLAGAAIALPLLVKR